MLPELKTKRTSWSEMFVLPNSSENGCQLIFKITFSDLVLIGRTFFKISRSLQNLVYHFAQTDYTFFIF